MNDVSELREVLDGVLSTLPEQYTTCLYLRYGLDGGEPQTFKEIGKILGKTVEGARQIHSRALRRLRHPTRLTKVIEDFYGSEPWDGCLPPEPLRGKTIPPPEGFKWVTHRYREKRFKVVREDFNHYCERQPRRPDPPKPQFSWLYSGLCEEPPVVYDRKCVHRCGTWVRLGNPKCVLQPSSYLERMQNRLTKLGYANTEMGVWKHVGRVVKFFTYPYCHRYVWVVVTTIDGR